MQMFFRITLKYSQLADEIVNRLPEKHFISNTSTFLDPAYAGGQLLQAIARRLAKYGHSLENIKNRLFGYENNAVYLNHSANYPTAAITNLSVVRYDTFIKEDMSMKFDVIVGNPPFQDPSATSSKKLWPDFVRTSFTMLKHDGTLAMITPASWMSGKSDIFDLIKKHSVYIDTNVKKYFPGVGSSFSYYILTKNRATQHAEINDIGLVNMLNLDLLPAPCTAQSMSIVQKLISKDNAVPVQTSSLMHSQRTDRVKKDQCSVYKYPNMHASPRSDSAILWSDSPHPDSAKSKVIMYMSGKPYLIYDTGVYGVTQHSAYILVSKPDAVGLISYFNSKLVRFILDVTTTAAAWNIAALRQLPAVDFSRQWTDTELYKFFGLTQEEIDYVEANVK